MPTSPESKKQHEGEKLLMDFGGDVPDSNKLSWEESAWEDIGGKTSSKGYQRIRSKND